jgi:hypothetical protein
MNRALGVVTSGVVAGGLMFGAAGCGGEAPALETPNNTIEVAASNINYVPALSALTLQQTIRITLPSVPGETHDERLDMWNYTNSAVNPGEFKAISSWLLSSVASSANTWQFPINYNDGTTSETLNISTTAIPKNDIEHDMILVPNNEQAPPGFGEKVTQTEYLDRMQPSEPEAVSVVYQPENQSDDLESFFGMDSGLSTEMCQSEVELAPIIDNAETDLDPGIIQRLIQETLCNSEGIMINAIMNGWNYSQYANYLSNIRNHYDATISGDGLTWDLDLITFSSDAYANARQALIAGS